MKFKIIPLITFLVLVVSCSSNDDPNENITSNTQVSVTSKITKQKKSLNYADALIVAQLFNAQQTKLNPENKRSIAIQTKLSEDEQLIKDNNNNPIAYVVNFIPSGFCIVSATKQNHPILSYSKEGHINPKETSNSPLKIWIEEIADMSTNADQIPDSVQVDIQNAWRKYEDTSTTNNATTKFTNPAQLSAYQERRNYYGRQGIMVSTLDNPGDLPSSLCNKIRSLANYLHSPEEFTILIVDTKKISNKVDELLKTKWHQNQPYNTSIPNWAKVGCSAVAAGQIMKFFEYPKNYDWDEMNYNNDYISSFLYDLGMSFKIEYGKSSSSATKENVKNGLINSFNYAAEIVPHNINKIKTYLLDYKYPVYCRGNAQNENGHAWVCDGYEQNRTHYTVKVDLLSNTTYHLYSSTFETTVDGTDYVHYNWGWNITSYSNANGWYYSTSAKPTNFLNPSENIGDFSYERDEIFMHPQQ